LYLLRLYEAEMLKTGKSRAVFILFKKCLFCQDIMKGEEEFDDLPGVGSSAFPLNL